MTAGTRPLAIGADLPRVDGPEKVTGSAVYAYEQPAPAPGSAPDAAPYGAAATAPAYVCPLQATIARGRVIGLDTERAAAADGVLTVLTPRTAARLADTGDRELAVLQSDRVAFRGQFIGAVVARTPEAARHAATLVSVEYAEEPHATELRADDPDLGTPEQLNGGFVPDTDEGDVDAALAAAAVTIDRTYTTPMEHNHPMEPHAAVAVWHADGDSAPHGAPAGAAHGAPDSAPDGAPPRLTLYASTQGAHSVHQVLTRLFDLAPDQLRVISPHVGGGFGSKGLPHAHDVLAALCARALPGRPVKLALTRQQMFCLAGHRTPTVQRLRLGADATGRLTAIVHEAVEHTSTIKEFAEQTAAGTRMMYAAPNRRTTHRIAALDVPVPSWMRAPGEAPGIFALEVAMDELAEAAGLDPIELRVRNDPPADPATGKPWSGRHLVRCLAEGARRFGWEQRNAAPGARREGRELVGLGVAAATYPYYTSGGSRARVRYEGDGRWTVAIGAADLGTGARTVLTQIAADALECPAASVTVELGDTRLPVATVAGGSSGTATWGTAVTAAADAFRTEHGPGRDARPGAEAYGDSRPHADTKRFAIHSFGAHFAEVRVDADTGEIRVPRLLGIFSAGRIINPRTARSQFIGGMTMGLSMALHEQSVLDHRTGHVINHDLAGYHIAGHADTLGIEAHWLDEDDPHTNPMGARGIGEIGIVGCPAAIVNAVHNATGLRVRDLPVTPDKLLH